MRRYRDKRGRFKRKPKIRRDEHGRFVKRLKKKSAPKTRKEVEEVSSGVWVPIKDRLKDIREEFDIDRAAVDYPPPWIKWANSENNFWSWVKKFPPIPHDEAEYVKIEVWYVVYHELMEEHLLRSASRSSGMVMGVEWPDVLKIKGDLQSDVLTRVENTDYLEFQDFVGWSAYPNANWYNRKVKYRRRGQF